ncbi:MULTISPECIES: DUF4239 domain-containing protein [unclassified Kitasatospora]|uniref:bestrophin-like domain n=1 Tax=unclassified Kitasatospora TaxID=2633591 RepID=UPI00070977CD|nr:MULTISPECIES: DUF4239 domain-containing protein [unclassified Kitasatospora]KQV15456.1 hypothetical protein ASC99_07635 [Kitasatospora sp. Root107]KRB63956.1 hypothetical protein ASE03_05230 [Kitasatospora sp. Root187]
MSLSAIVLAASCVFVSILTLFLMVRYVPQRWREGSGLQDGIEHFSALNRTLFSFILALSIVSAGASLSKAADEVSSEGSSLVNLYWATRPLSEKPRAEVRDLARRYTATVIDEEWPAMAEGRSSPGAQALYDELRRVLQDTEGGSKQEQTFARDSLVALREVGDARRARMLAVSQEVPNYLWIGLILSAVLLVATSALQIQTLTWPGVLGIGGLALLLSSVLTLLSAMNHPFGGGIHVEPDSLEFALNRFSVI